MMPAVDLPVGGSTGLSHEHSATIDEAVAWLIHTPRRQRGPAVAELRKRFGLSNHEACLACHEAHLARPRAA